MAAKPLVVIVGQTGSGKTALGIELAHQFDGEIIAADSRTVYRGMDIGTAKPSRLEQQGIPHHLIDVVNPDETFTAADFKRLANKAIDDITNRGRLPIIVGGTGLYVDALLYDFEFRTVADPAERTRLQAMSVQALQAEIRDKGLPMPENQQNPRHLMRIIETNGAVAERKELRPDTLVLGLEIDPDKARFRITQRVHTMLEAGLIEEVRTLCESFGKNAEALRAPGYRAFIEYMDGTKTLEQATEQFVKNDIALAKRQRTWFRRNKSIHWIKNQEQAVDLLTSFLNKYRI